MQAWPKTCGLLPSPFLFKTCTVFTLDIQQPGYRNISITAKSLHATTSHWSGYFPLENSSTNTSKNTPTFPAEVTHLAFRKPLNTSKRYLWKQMVWGSYNPMPKVQSDLIKGLSPFLPALWWTFTKRFLHKHFQKCSSHISRLWNHLMTILERTKNRV